MKAIETTGTFDKSGLLKLANEDVFSSKKVKVIILFNDDDEIGDKLWLSANATNSSFDFLKDEMEDIYTINDGKPISE